MGAQVNPMACVLRNHGALQQSRRMLLARASKRRLCACTQACAVAEDVPRCSAHACTAPTVIIDCSFESQEQEGELSRLMIDCFMRNCMDGAPCCRCMCMYCSGCLQICRSKVHACVTHIKEAGFRQGSAVLGKTAGAVLRSEQKVWQPAQHHGKQLGRGSAHRSSEDGQPCLAD